MQTCGMDTIEDLKSVLGGGSSSTADATPADLDSDQESKASDAKSRKSNDQQAINSVEVISIQIVPLYPLSPYHFLSSSSGPVPPS